MLNLSRQRHKMKSQITRTTSTSSFSNVEEDFSPPKNLVSDYESNVILLAQKLAYKVLLINKQWKKRTRSEMNSDRERLDFLHETANANYEEIRHQRKKREKEYKFLQQERLKQSKMKDKIAESKSQIKLSLHNIAEIKKISKELSASFSENAQKYENEVFRIEEYELVHAQLTKRVDFLNSSVSEKQKEKENLRQKAREITIKNHALKATIEEKSNFLSSKTIELDSIMKALSEKSKVVEDELFSTEKRITEMQSRISTSKFCPF